jgi:hypothetical protein
VLPEDADDSTSYVHNDLRIEWCGTSWEPGPRAVSSAPHRG